MKHADTELIEAATEVRENAFAPHSNFQVGAAVETENGEIYTGCNVESASYGLTICAERVAIWKGVSHGEKKFGRIAVVVDTEELTPPCGACRQIIWEFCGDVPVILANLHGKTETVQMAELLPRAFDSEVFEVKMDNRKDIPEIRLDRSKITVVSGFDDSDEVEYWRGTTVKERLQHIERLRRLNYGIRATERLQRVIRVTKCE